MNTGQNGSERAKVRYGLLQTKQIRNTQGATRTYYRYGSGRWYRSLASAQIAKQRT